MLVLRFWSVFRSNEGFGGDVVVGFSAVGGSSSSTADGGSTSVVGATHGLATEKNNYVVSIQ